MDTGFLGGAKYKISVFGPKAKMKSVKYLYGLPPLDFKKFFIELLKVSRIDTIKNYKTVLDTFSVRYATQKNLELTFYLLDNAIENMEKALTYIPKPLK